MKHSKIQLLLFLMFLASTRSLWLRRRYQRTFARPVHPVFNFNRPKIVGGIEATPHSIPYQAALSCDGKFFCGGILITREYVLTAAHCAELTRRPTITLGAHNIYKYEKETQIISGKRRIIHEKYQPNTIENDIALIALEKRATLNAYVGTIPLPRPDAPSFADSLLRVSGWGKTGTNSGGSEVLRFISIRGLSNTICQRFFDDSTIHDSMICADTTREKSACFGDSGGPLVHVKSHLLVGVFSFLHHNDCESGMPVGFTRVSHYAEWIHEKIL